MYIQYIMPCICIHIYIYIEHISVVCASVPIIYPLTPLGFPGSGEIFNGLSALTATAT